MPVFDVIQEQDELKAHEHHFYLWPRKWKKYLDTHNWEICRLNATERDRIPKGSGVYSILIQPGIANHPACSYLMYVGKTESLRRRFMDYFNEKKRETGRPKIFRILNKYEDYVCFCYTIVSISDLSDVEDNLLIAYIPPNNDQYPAEIRRIVGAF